LVKSTEYKDAASTQRPAKHTVKERPPGEKIGARLSLSKGRLLKTANKPYLSPSGWKQGKKMTLNYPYDNVKTQRIRDHRGTAGGKLGKGRSRVMGLREDV